VQHALTRGGTGRRGTQSVRRAVPRLQAAGNVPMSRSTVQRALADASWTWQEPEKTLPVTANRNSRVAFCQREGRTISMRTSFSDSKYWEGEATSKTRVGKEWAPVGAPPTVETVQKASYVIHAYAAITRFGATPLYECAGTRGPSGRRPGRPAANAPPAPPAPPPTLTAVQYRSLLDNGAGRGMLLDVDAIFRAQGITSWRWQQDGAPSHTIANTTLGRDTRALIESHAELMDDWPAHSADLSPIEKAWAATSHYLYAHETWHDLATFKVALHHAWSVVVTPAYCRSLFAGVRNTYAVCVQKSGAQVKGWGQRAK
jgi:hypothetical protein